MAKHRYSDGKLPRSIWIETPFPVVRHKKPPNRAYRRLLISGIIGVAFIVIGVSPAFTNVGPSMQFIADAFVRLYIPS